MSATSLSLTPERRAKKNPIISDRVFRFKAWRCPTLTWGGPTLPSALSCFTSEFGMGSGGSNSLLPPDKLVEKSKSDTVLQVSDSYFSKLESQYTLSITSNILYIQVLTNKHLRVSKNTWGYMVKPYGQLVQVSFTHYCASTPCLSTS